MSDESAPARRVSEKDRDYMRRLGEFEAENARDDEAAHRARTMDERLAYSWMLTQRLGAAIRRLEDYDASATFYAKARELGLIIR
ncbi:MAG: hypothetical protein AB7T37_14805 [Dehalococcoidia bacterium]